MTSLELGAIVLNRESHLKTFRRNYYSPTSKSCMYMVENYNGKICYSVKEISYYEKLLLERSSARRVAGKLLLKCREGSDAECYRKSCC